MGIGTMNNVTMENLTRIFNVTDPGAFFVNANYTIYGGWFYFIMLWLLGILLFKKAQEKEDQPLINAMNVSSILTVLSFLLRAIYITVDGVQLGLINDLQMWLFPLITVVLAGIVKYTSD